MPDVHTNGLDIRYETTGDPADPPLLLIMGLGCQLIDWPQEFVDGLAARGFHVITFDNRDAGLSTELTALGVPDTGAILGGDNETRPYLIADLAADTAGLLKELGIPRAHVAGVSLGGMIAQQLTIDHPALVASLCSIMSTTGDRMVGYPSMDAAAALLRPRVGTPDELIAGSIESARVLGSPAYPAPDEEIIRNARIKMERSFRPVGFQRQYAAIIGSPDRTEGLRAVRVPTVVIHGEADALVDVSGGRATADAIEGAELIVIPGMGHDLPRELWPQLIEAIVANIARV